MISSEIYYYFSGKKAFDEKGLQFLEQTFNNIWKKNIELFC